MKKKSLLIAMAAMSVAAIGAGTVSTMAWFSVDNAQVASHSAEDEMTVTKSFDLGSYKITYSVEATDGVYLTKNTDGKAYFYSNGEVEHTTADPKYGTYKVSTLSWLDDSTYDVPADDVIATITGYYAVTITASGNVKLLKANATSAVGAGESNEDITTAKAWIRITAGHANAALSWSIEGEDSSTVEADQSDGFTEIGTSSDNGKLIGKFAVRPVDTDDGDDDYYNADGTAKSGKTANKITVSWNGKSNS